MALYRTPPAFILPILESFNYSGPVNFRNLDLQNPKLTLIECIQYLGGAYEFRIKEEDC